MRRPIAVVLVAAVVFGTSATIVRAEDLGDQVRQAIDQGVAYLKGRQRDDGSWPDRISPVGGVSHAGGISALCSLALLNSGVEPEDEHLQRALSYLRKLRPKATYVVALQTMVFCRAEPKADLLRIRENVKWLESMQIPSGSNAGAWWYGSISGGDNSNSQFALLALHEAERAGVPVQDRTWRLAKAYWESCQLPDGSWGYQKGQGDGGTGSMTCAGVASLIITGDRVRAANAKATGERIECCLRTPDEDNRIENGLRWLGRNFSVARNPNSPGRWHLYYLYGLERAGRLSARRFIGSHDWYREGCGELVQAQDSLSGFIKGAGYAEDDPLIGTSFALLFLSKGRWPALLAKLEHGRGDDWNQHRSDVANLSCFVESCWGLDLTWQVIDLDTAKVEDLLQVPVVYLCGDRSPLPADAEEQQQLARKLRDYLDRGGFLFAEGYRGGAEFDHGFRQLIEQVFPEPQYRLRLLEPEHPVWHAERPVPPDQLRPLYGIEFGCRTSVIYASPAPPRPSLSCLWELSRSGRGQEFVPKVQAQIDAALVIGANVLAYATNRELQSKEQLFFTPAKEPREDTLVRGRMSVATLRHSGGCNAAPRALVTLLETAAEKLGIRVDTREYLILLTDPTLFDHHLVFMQGRSRFHLSEAERGQLKTYIERGGMLFADAICASEAFGESFRGEMAATFGARKLEPIPADDPLLTPAYGGYDLRLVTRRDPETGNGSGPLRAKLRRVPPELEGIRFGDRWGVVFSKYDLSCALEKHDSLQCRGYVREDAARIGLNIILYSLQQ
jgi:hypothetical protein